MISSQNAILPRALIQAKLLRYRLQSHGSTSLLGFGLGMQEAGLCHEQQNLMGLMVFLVGTAPGGLLHVLEPSAQAAQRCIG